MRQLCGGWKTRGPLDDRAFALFQIARLLCAEPRFAGQNSSTHRLTGCFVTGFSLDNPAPLAEGKTAQFFCSGLTHFIRIDRLACVDFASMRSRWSIREQLFARLPPQVRLLVRRERQGMVDVRLKAGFKTGPTFPTPNCAFLGGMGLPRGTRRPSLCRLYIAACAPVGIRILFNRTARHDNNAAWTLCRQGINRGSERIPSAQRSYEGLNNRLLLGLETVQPSRTSDSSSLQSRMNAAST